MIKALVFNRYGNASFVDELHRDTYEVNPDMIAQLESVGLSFVSKDETGGRMEICELTQLPYYVGVQLHPDFKSIPGKKSPLFLDIWSFFQHPGMLLLVSFPATQLVALLIAVYANSAIARVRVFG